MLKTFEEILAELNKAHTGTTDNRYLFKDILERLIDLENRLEKLENGFPIP